jgi:hypothetical protein
MATEYRYVYVPTMFAKEDTVLLIYSAPRRPVHPLDPYIVGKP